jgi:DNA-binding MarR family transcriptional regulator
MKKELSQEIVHLFSVIHRTIRQRMTDYSVDLHGLSLMQWQAMVYVKREEKVTMSDLARQFQVSGAAATMLVDKLVAANFLLRERDKEDRRVVYLTLSPEIDQRFTKLFQKKQEMISGFLEGIDEQDAKDLIRILKKITRNLHP